MSGARSADISSAIKVEKNGVKTGTFSEGTGFLGPDIRMNRKNSSGGKEKGRATANIVAAEVSIMLTAAWLMLGTLLYSLQLNTGSFPRPLSESEEQRYLILAKEGDLEARNILIERNLRLVAHIMNKG